MKRVTEFIKALAVIGAVLFGIGMVLSFAEAHALNVHVKEPAKPPTYLVEGKEVNAAEATIAVLQGKTALKCQQMEVEAGRNGLSL